MAGILINGVNYSWSSIQNYAFGVPVIGILSIEWNREQDKVNNYGLGTEPISRGYGNITYQGQMTVYKDWWMSVINAAPNKDILQIAPFDWTIAYGNASTPVTTETLNMLEFTKDSMKSSQGDTKIQIDVPFIFAGVTRL